MSFLKLKGSILKVCSILDRFIFMLLFISVLVQRGSKIGDHIIIGTPGKVLDWATTFKFFDLSKINVFVLDEADVMIATQGHQDQCIRIHK